MSIYREIKKSADSGRKKFAVLIDPDKWLANNLNYIFENEIDRQIDYFLIGGSMVIDNHPDSVIRYLITQTTVPIILFPGNAFQLCDEADAVLFLSLISGRNPDFLIGKHVIAAPFLNRSSLEIIPTGYILIDGGKPTAVSYMSNTVPIPGDKWDIAQYTALAGQMLGLKVIYMDAGSGANKTVSVEMVAKVKEKIRIPLLIGGGISTAELAENLTNAGADLIVVGNAVENEPGLITEISDAIQSSSKNLKRV